MGTFVAIIKLVVVALILSVSYLAVEGLLISADAILSTAGATSARLPALGEILLITTLVSVGSFFTVPAILAMFGRAGSWVRAVLARMWIELVMGWVFSFSLYLLGGIASSAAGVRAPPVATEPLAIGLLAVFAMMALGRGLLVNKLTPSLLSSISGFSLPSADLLLRRPENVASVELLQAPAARIRDKATTENVRAEADRFHRLARGLAGLEGKVEFALEFRHGRGTLMLSERARRSQAALARQLLAAARAYLPEFRPSLVEPSVQPSQARHRCTILVGGAPGVEAQEEPLEPLARYFLENDYEGSYRVVFEGAGLGRLRRALARRRQRESAKKAGQQVTAPSPVGNEQKATTVVDRLAELELEESVRAAERHGSREAVRVWVLLTGCGGTSEEAIQVAEGAAHALCVTLSSPDAASALRKTRLGRTEDPKPAQTHGAPSILLPKEAAPYLWIPQVAMGGEIVPAAEFELSPELEGEVELGRVVVNSAETGHDARIALASLTKHVFITGMTGSGKTTSCFNLLVQLHQLGIPFLVIEPVKSEYRALLVHVPGLQVFTLGDEDTAPFRLNIFEPPEGVRVQRHIESLEAAWNASFVMYAPLPYVLRAVLEETYRACGWDALRNKRGRPVTLHDFRAQAQKVSRGLGYEPKVIMDIEAALKMRITSFALGGKGPMFDALSSIPLDDVLRRPTVLELKSITSGEEKAFVAALILARLAEYIESRGGSKQLRHVTLVEEAHRLLPNVSTQKGDPEAADPRRHTVEQFGNMLAEFRALGEGLVVVEQIPTKILPDAIKNTATKLAHRVPAADDREILAGAMNMTEEQSRVLSALQPGEAILSVEKVAFPVRIRANDVVGKKGLPVGEVSDEWVKRQMTPFYLRNPLPKAAESFLKDEITSLVDSDSFEQKFRMSYREWLRNKDSEPLCQLVISSAKVLATGDHDVVEMASRILPLAVAWYLPFDEEDREKFPQMFMQKVRKSMRGDGTTRR